MECQTVGHAAWNHIETDILVVSDFSDKRVLACKRVVLDRDLKRVISLTKELLRGLNNLRGAVHTRVEITGQDPNPMLSARKQALNYDSGMFG